MIKVKLSTPNKDFPIIRQTPSSSGIWGNCHFFINDRSNQEFDCWVVYDELSEDEMTICNYDNIIFITAEPPSVKSYDSNFLKQFTKVITCHKNLKHPSIIQSQQGQVWMAGVEFLNETKSWNLSNYKDINELSEGVVQEKLDKVCIITSNKAFTKGHSKRLNFILKLKSELPDLIDIYGVGFSPIKDKLEVLGKYKYSLVIENSVNENYWTEKLSDAFIAETYPIYYGCPNVYSYFASDSLSLIEIENLQESIEKIKSLVQQDYFSLKKQEVFKAKELVLFKYNIFEIISSNLNKNFQSERLPVELKSSNKIKNKPITFLRKILLWCCKKRFIN